jgi:hypothetical protein
MTSMLLALLWSTAAVPAASPVGGLLECDDATALAADWTELGQRLSAGAQCDEHRYPSGAELECRARSPFLAYGLSGQEFILREVHGGRRELRGVFRAGADALRAAAQRRHRGVFEPDGANGWTLQIDAQRSVRVDVREDGAAELACAVAGAQADDARRAVPTRRMAPWPGDSRFRRRRCRRCASAPCRPRARAGSACARAPRRETGAICSAA